MNVIYSVKDYVSNVFHATAAAHAMDVVVVQQSNGGLQCSSFHVHFGSVHTRKQHSGTQHVVLEVNGHVVDSVRMKMDAAGEAYFVQPVEEHDSFIVPSPPSSIGDMDELAQNHSFGIKDNALEPHDEDDAVRHGQQRVTWGVDNLALIDKASASEDDELPSMVKSASVYFDAVDVDAPTMAADGKHGDYYDHPSMSLCGHLLDEAETKQEAHRIFCEHVISFDFFRANSASVLANPELRFFVDGKMASYDADMQAYLVSRVLFPYSQHLTVGTLMNGYADNRDLPMGQVQTGDAKRRGMSCDESIDKCGYSFSHSGPRLGPATPEQLDDVCSDDAGSTQDTASIASEYYSKKSLKPSQEELLEMGLRVGTNDIAFVLRSHGMGEVARVTANLYLWPVTTKVVIAHIDGAISSSATTGRVFKRRDPAAMHPGVVEFYSKLARNGYRVVYVTSHGVLQANLHHTLLHNSPSEDGEIALPMGPVLLSPDHLLASYSNEIIDMQGVKLAALDDLRSLFPRCVNPFYAAFGTTQADSVVFTQVGVFPGKVFVVDPADGSLRHHSLLDFHESYSSLLHRTDAMFPPIYSPTTQILSSPHSCAQSVVRALQSVPSNRSTTSHAVLVTDEEQIVVETVVSQFRARNLDDEAYNDINFWRLKPGHV